MVHGLHGIVVTDDHGSATVDDRIDIAGEFVPVDI